MVAKSYQKLKQACDPYVKSNGRMYVKVIGTNGKEKEVRWYSEDEYAKMYPADVIETDPFKNQKDILGFQKGYITIFKGDQEKYEDWFNRSIARYCRFWGWYIVSEDVVPFDLPHDIEPIELSWDLVGIGTKLRDEEDVRTAINSLLYGAHPSTFQGCIGDRLDMTITVIKAEKHENRYGNTYFHTFEDKCGNHYMWNTGAKFWECGSVKHIRGSVKEHRVINNIQTTVLTRCMEQ